MHQREPSALPPGMKVRRGMGGSLKEERVASEEGVPPSAPQPFSEISVFQDSQLSLAFAGRARQSLIPEKGRVLSTLAWGFSIWISGCASMCHRV